MAEKAGPPGPLKGCERMAVLVMAVLCGAAVMELEVLGARIVSPWFGVSLFVWTALITVTLLSLAVGYYLGGRAADRRGSLRLLGLLVGLAGLWLLLTLFLRVPVLRAAVGLGVRGGALAAALLLFGPPLTLLGMVSPFCVQLILKDLRESGRTVGRLAALSTVGSFAGTLVTGFWLIPAFHVSQILAGSAFLLLALCALALTAASRRHAFALLLPLPAVLFLGRPPLARVVQPNGTKAEVVCREGSFYGQISVVDYTFPPRHTREMLIDGIIQGGIDVVDGQPIYPYTYALERAALTYNPGARRALVIGLGPGCVPARLARHGMTGDVVEIDPKVLDLAKRFFGFSEGAFTVVLDDGRTFLEKTSEKYDLVFLDAFSAENEPTYLLTQEAFRSMLRALNPGGVLAINLSGLAPGPGADNTALDSVMRTMATVFEETHAFMLAGAQSHSTIGFTLVGRVPGGHAAAAAAQALPVHPMALPALEGLLERMYSPKEGSGAVYTDDWAPIEAQAAEVKLLWRRAEIAATPAEILLD
jgi:spermidine synthase